MCSSDLLWTAKTDAAIDRQPLLAARGRAAIEVQVHADFAGSAERKKRQIAACRVHSKLSFLGHRVGCVVFRVRRYKGKLADSREGV